MAGHRDRRYRSGKTPHGDASAMPAEGAPAVTDPRRDAQALRPHPLANLLPAMEGAEYKAFVADIAERGLLNPLAITAEGIVLDGHHRLRAAHELGLAQVPVRVVAPADERAYMLKAALRRRNLNADQKAALALELIDYDSRREQALKRRQANLPGKDSEVATLPLRGRTREYAAEVGGVGARTVQDVITVREADPALFEQVKAGTTRAHAEAQRIAHERRLRKLGETPLLTEGPFALIYCDPPWASDNLTASWAPENHYPTMALANIKSLRVPAADDALLLLWAVNCQLPQALEVLSAWGFEYTGNLVWVKPSPGVGQRIRNQHELLLLGVRGRFPCPAGADVPASVIAAERGPHSQKPECVYELIERMYPDCPKLELFARGRARPGWTAWGNEVEQ